MTQPVVAHRAVKPLDICILLWIAGVDMLLPQWIDDFWGWKVPFFWGEGNVLVVLFSCAVFTIFCGIFYAKRSEEIALVRSNLQYLYESGIENGFLGQ